jgi:hypothetical protein
MPKRPEDPSLLGFIISFDPLEEERRLQEEKEQKRLAKKSKNKRNHDSSICSGATESTSKSESNSSNGPSSTVPDKIVTHVVVEDIVQPASSTDEMDASPSSELEKQVTSHQKVAGRTHKSKQNEKYKKVKSKEMKKKENRKEKKQAKRRAKKEEKRQKAAACNIQRVARGYLVRRDLTERKDADQVNDQEETVPPNTTPTVGRFARVRQALSRGRRKEAAASRVQRVFRIHNMRQLFKRGDKDRWQSAWHRFFLFSLLRPLERIRKKKHLMQVQTSVDQDEGQNEGQDDDSSTGTAEPESGILAIHQDMSIASNSPIRPTNADLLDVIPEDQTRCEQVDNLLSPFGEFDESEHSVTSE